MYHSFGKLEVRACYVRPKSEKLQLARLFGCSGAAGSDCCKKNVAIFILAVILFVRRLR
jgi:hypothetical protein